MKMNAGTEGPHTCVQFQSAKQPFLSRFVRRCLFSLLILGIVVSYGPSFAGSISGTYVGWSDTGVFLVEIVQTNDGQLAGRFEQVLLQPSGSLKDTNGAISGVIDKGTVVVTVKPHEFLSETITLSGTSDGQTLRLAGSGYKLDLASADQDAFRAQISNLTDRAARIRQAIVQADVLAKMEKLAVSIKVFNGVAAAEIKRVAATEQQLKAITMRMRSALTKQVTIKGVGEADVARGQISVLINQAGIQASQIYGKVDATHRDFDIKSRSYIDQLAFAEPKCEAIVNEVESASYLGDVNRWKSICEDVLDGAKIFNAHVASLRKSFTQIAAVWSDERKQQVAIVQASDDDVR